MASPAPPSPSRPTLLSLPTDVLAIVLAECELADVGHLSMSCWTFSRLIGDAANSALWDGLCHRQGLIEHSLPPTPPKERLRRAALCTHARLGTWSDYQWSRGMAGPGPAFGFAFCATCTHCGRQYRVSKENVRDDHGGETGTTYRMHFSALHEAPRKQRTWSLVWDRRAVAAVVKAVLLTRHSAIPLPRRCSEPSLTGDTISRRSVEQLAFACAGDLRR